MEKLSQYYYHICIDIRAFGLLSVPFVNVYQFVSFVLKGWMWDLVVLVPDHCLSFYYVFL